MKPTRSEFIAQVKALAPEAGFFENDGGLFIVVSSADAAMAVAFKATEGRLRVAGISTRSDGFLVRVFGFPRPTKEKP